MNDGAPYGWCVTSIGEICNIAIGGTPSRQVPEYWDSTKVSGYPWVSIRDLKKSIVYETSEYISDAGVKNSNVKMVKKGTVLMSFKLSVGRVAFAGRDLYTNEAIAALIPKANQFLSSKFLYQGLQQWNLLENIDQAVKGVTLNKDKINQIEALLPPLPEQKKIATILSSVDTVIEKTRAQIDKLKDLKTGMMQELLTKGIGPGGVPHTEFKDSPVGRIPASWGTRALCELASIKHGYAFEGEYFRPSPTPYVLLTPGNFNKDGRLYFGSKTKYYDGPVPADFILENGDVLVVMTDLTKEMAILGNAIILKSPSTVLHNQRIGKVTILDENTLSPEYLCFVMNSDQVNGHIKDTATGTTVRHTSPTKILEPLIPIPPIEEQEMIMMVVQALEDRLTVAESKLASTERIKKALMQDLLTGKVRVQVEEHEAESAVA